MNVKVVDAYKCSNCGQVYLSEELAEKCCHPYHCEDCGRETPRYFTRCSFCQEKRWFENATKMTIAEWNEQYPNNMVVHGDTYYCSVDECLESIFGDCCDDKEVDEIVNNLQYIKGTSQFRVELDADNIIEDLESNSGFEEWYVDDEGRKELDQFLKEWNKKYGQDGYSETNIAILISEEEMKEYIG